MEKNHSDTARGWYRRRNLPHFDAPGTLQHLVLHVFDPARQSLKNRIRDPPTPCDPSPLKHSAPSICLTDPPTIAEIVSEALVYGHQKRYSLLEWVVMPTHVHVLIKQGTDWPLGKVVQCWKRHTTKRIKALLGRDALPQLGDRLAVWQTGYWDRYIRTDADLQGVRRYIRNNPVEVGLVLTPSDWPWSSAHS